MALAHIFLLRLLPPAWPCCLPQWPCAACCGPSSWNCEEQTVFSVALLIHLALHSWTINDNTYIEKHGLRGLEQCSSKYSWCKTRVFISFHFEFLTDCMTSWVTRMQFTPCLTVCVRGPQTSSSRGAPDVANMKLLQTLLSACLYFSVLVWAGIHNRQSTHWHWSMGHTLRSSGLELIAKWITVQSSPFCVISIQVSVS